MSDLHRSPAERTQAWLVTGPAGHLWSALIDVALLAARLVKKSSVVSR